MSPSTAPSLIATQLPEFELRELDRVAVAASPAEAWAAARAIDLGRIPFARALFELRTLPDRVGAWLGRNPPVPPLSLRIDDLARPGAGFRILAEQPGWEVVVGAVGRFWEPAIPFVPISPAGFAAFDEPGHGKVAWCIRVDPRVGGGSWVTAEVRVQTTDPDAHARFQRYWRVIGRFSHAIRRAALKRIAAELGAPPPDADRPLPGDAILGEARFVKTHAITIEAPPAQVWPWLVQIGATRAGWYSWDLLDNGGTPSARRIIPALQELRVGDRIPALPETPGGFAVLALDREEALVLGDPSLDRAAERPPNAPPWKTTWAFVLEPIGPTATQLTVRVRATWAPRAKMRVVAPVMGAIHEVMERRQLSNLRRRAEDPRA